MATKKTTKSSKAAGSTKTAAKAKSATKTKAATKTASNTTAAKAVTKTTEAAKPAAPKRSRTKAAITKPVAAAKAARVAAVPDTATKEITKKALVEDFMEESGMKKGDARRAVDAMLVVLHKALHDGNDIAAAPLGKIKIVRKKETPNGQLAVLRVKLRDPDKMPNLQAANEGVADAAE